MDREVQIRNVPGEGHREEGRTYGLWDLQERRDKSSGPMKGRKLLDEVGWRRSQDGRVPGRDSDLRTTGGWCDLLNRNESKEERPLPEEVPPDSRDLPSWHGTEEEGRGEYGYLSPSTLLWSGRDGASEIRGEGRTKRFTETLWSHDPRTLTPGGRPGEEWDPMGFRTWGTPCTSRKTTQVFRKEVVNQHSNSLNLKRKTFIRRLIGLSPGLSVLRDLYRRSRVRQ